MKRRMLATMLILLGVLLLLHHFYLTGRLFDSKDILNHEFFEAILFAAGVAILISSYDNGK